MIIMVVIITTQCLISSLKFRHLQVNKNYTTEKIHLYKTMTGGDKE